MDRDAVQASALTYRPPSGVGAGVCPALREPRSSSSMHAVREGATLRLVFAGVMTAETLHVPEKAVPDALRSAHTDVVLDLQGVSRMDTAGALFLNLTLDGLRRAGRSCVLHDPGERFTRLLRIAPPAAETAANGQTRPGEERGKQAAPAAFFVERLIATLERADAALLARLRSVGALVGFFGAFLCIGGGMILHPGRMRFTSLVFHMEQCGLRAVPIVALLTFLIGMVVAYMGAQQLGMFGAQDFAVNLLEITVLREMAVLITSIVAAGRTASSFTAQIGAMTANEETAALLSMGLDPMVLLVVPRVSAMILCLPMLVFLADITALLGGACALYFSLDMDLQAFITRFYAVAKLKHLVVGLVKTPFFAAAIALVGCFHGFRATRNAESVGFLTTVSVVQAIFFVILLDALFALFFTVLRI
ncbi:MAG: ABC transporter permease [Desulfovibrio sp.]|jgi:phospholipid/cholesterol/gamma-HCH transport system permease protein|nr:ABC transporter permease [Desulfovibrio sp.]